MSHTCPKCSARLPIPPIEMRQCPECGIYFAKYQAQQAGIPLRARVHDFQELEVDLTGLELWRSRLLPERPFNNQQLAGWGLLLTILIVWGLYFIACDWKSGEIMESFLHQPNLAFHEAGHVLFIPLGEFMTILGGSLFQCLVPLIIVIAFLRRNDPMGASAGLWWCGQNLLDVAPYIADARALQLPLIGESSDEMVDNRIFRHDWHNILERLDILSWDIGLARVTWMCGTLLMLLAMFWLGRILHLQWQLRSAAH